MRITLQEIKEYFILIGSFAVCLCIINVSDDILCHVVIFLFFCIAQMALVRFDLTHPYCWFSFFFGLYSCGFPIIEMIGIISRACYYKEVMIYQLIALFVFLFTVGPRKNINVIPFNSQYIGNVGIINKVVYIIVNGIVLASGIYVYLGGYIGKGQIYSDGGVLLNFAFKLPLVLSLMATIFFFFDYLNNDDKALRKLIVPGVVLFIITIFSGERDFTFRFIMMTLISVWVLKIINIKHVLMFIPFLMILIPVSTIYKYYFTQGSVAEMAASSGLVFSLFYGEFESASSNLQILLNDSSTEGKFGYIQIMYDVASAFCSDIPSTGYWFNETYYPNSLDVQYGFSLVGEGYLIGGLLGIVFLFFVIGVITRWYYHHSCDGIYFMAGYIYYITTVIYSIRADFSTITSTISKQIGLVIMIIYVLAYVSENKRCSQNTVVRYKK